MSESIPLPVQFIATVGFGLLLNLTANKLPSKWADPVLRWGWFSVLIYLTYLVMSIDFIQRKLVPLAGSPVRSYIIAALIGTVVALVYWATIIRVHDRLITQAEEPAQQIASGSSSPAPTPVTPTPTPPTSPTSSVFPGAPVSPHKQPKHRSRERATEAVEAAKAVDLQQRKEKALKILRSPSD